MHLLLPQKSEVTYRQSGDEVCGLYVFSIISRGEGVVARGVPIGVVLIGSECFLFLVFYWVISTNQDPSVGEI